MSRFVLSVGGLALVYALTLASFAPADLAAGVVFASALLLGSRRFTFAGEMRPIAKWPQRLVGFVPFAVVVVWEIITGTVQVALVVLHLRPLNHPGIVVLPFDERTPLGVAIWALAVTLSPGSFPVEIDREERVMLVHFIDASDPDGIRAKQRRFYERYQRRVFP